VGYFSNGVHLQSGTSHNQNAIPTYLSVFGGERGNKKSGECSVVGGQANLGKVQPVRHLLGGKLHKVMIITAIPYG
jgi:hypothetical protein